MPYPRGRQYYHGFAPIDLEPITWPIYQREKRAVIDLKRYHKHRLRLGMLCGTTCWYCRKLGKEESASRADRVDYHIDKPKVGAEPLFGLKIWLDPYSIADWTSGETCEWLSLMEHFGLTDLDIEDCSFPYTGRFQGEFCSPAPQKMEETIGLLVPDLTQPVVVHAKSSGQKFGCMSKKSIQGAMDSSLLNLMRVPVSKLRRLHHIM
jgi:hypothetical protein